MDGSDSNKVYQFQFTTDYDWQYYWTTYGLSYPEEIRTAQRCPTMGTHGQIRMIPSSIYSARQLVPSEEETCPPEPCGKACISRFTDTQYFRRAYELREDLQNEFNSTLPLDYSDDILSENFINSMKDTVYKDYCEEIEKSKEDETDELLIHNTACHSSVAPECFQTIQILHLKTPLIMVVHPRNYIRPWTTCKPQGLSQTGPVQQYLNTCKGLRHLTIGKIYYLIMIIRIGRQV